MNVTIQALECGFVKETSVHDAQPPIIRVQENGLTVVTSVTRNSLYLRLLVKAVHKK